MWEKVVFATARDGHEAWMYWAEFEGSSKVGTAWYPIDGGMWKFWMVPKGGAEAGIPAWGSPDTIMCWLEGWSGGGGAVARVGLTAPPIGDC